MASSETKMTTAISWTFLLYFVILYAERIQSLARVGRDFLATGFDAYVDCIALLSLAAGLVLLAFRNPTFWKSLGGASVEVDWSMLTITAGVVLVSGMVHSEFTIAQVQFAAYGALIVGMVLRVVQTNPASFRAWYSLVYLTVFSMAIPVMYRAGIRNATLFHVIEAITALALVFFFTAMLRSLFLGSGSNLLWWAPVIVAAVLDFVVIAMRWAESRNMFVLIFAAASVALFALGKILFVFVKG